VGLAAPASLPVAWAVGLADGLAAEAEKAGASVVGGDVVAGEQVVVSVTALGTLEGREPVTRAGARAGDVVALVGRLGWSAAGLAVLTRGFRSPRVLVAAHRRPEPVYAAGPAAAKAGATAMVDVSDGLMSDLGRLAEASDVAITVDVAALEVADPVRDAAAALGKDPLEWVLTGGEDHALAATFPSRKAVPKGWTVVGEVLAWAGPADPSDGAEGAAHRVTVSGLPAGAYEGPGGWRHFSG
jgi:thiamine-monophosphate kinase